MNIGNQPPGATYKSWLTLSSPDMQPSAKPVEDGNGVASSMSLGAQEVIFHEDIYAENIQTDNTIEEVVVVDINTGGLLRRRSLSSIQNAILAAINTQISNIANQINSIQQDVTDLQNDVVTLQNQNTSQQSQINNLQAQTDTYLNTQNPVSSSLQPIRRGTTNTILNISTSQLNVGGELSVNTVNPANLLTEQEILIRGASNMIKQSSVNGLFNYYLQNNPQYYFREFSPPEATTTSNEGITSVTGMPYRLKVFVNNHQLHIKGYIFIPDGRTTFNQVTNSGVFNASNSSLYHTINNNMLITKPIVPLATIKCVDTITEHRVCLYRHINVTDLSTVRVMLATGVASLRIDEDFRIYVYFNNAIDYDTNHYNTNTPSITDFFNQRLNTFRLTSATEAGSYGLLQHGFAGPANLYFDVRPSGKNYLTTDVDLNNPLLSAGAFIHVDIATHIADYSLIDIKTYFDSI